MKFLLFFIIWFACCGSVEACGKSKLKLWHNSCGSHEECIDDKCVPKIPCNTSYGNYDCDIDVCNICCGNNGYCVTDTTLCVVEPDNPCNSWIWPFIGISSIVLIVCGVFCGFYWYMKKKVQIPLSLRAENRVQYAEYGYGEL
jgi:hypothetical protein